MWQRFKEAVDTRIQEEAARQRHERAASASSSPRSHPRTGSRPISPSRRSRRNVESLPSSETLVSVTGKGPDPSEFEPEFVIGDNSEMSTRVGTPVPSQVKSKEHIRDKGENAKAEEGLEDAEGKDDVAAKAVETQVLPQDVQLRLRKLERLEPKYAELLRSYRVAHARILLIESFESSLREHTPLTTIADSGALVEFLQQSNLKNTMLMEELKKAVYEMEDLKKRATAAEDRSKELESRLSLSTGADSKTIQNATAKQEQPSSEGDEGGEEFFSYENEIKNEVTDLQKIVSKLTAQNETMEKKLQEANEMVSEAKTSLETAQRELSEIKHAKDAQNGDHQLQVTKHEAEVANLKSTVQRLEDDLEARSMALDDVQQSLSEKHAELSKLTNNDLEIKRLTQNVHQLEKAAVSAKVTTDDYEKRNKTLQSLVDTLRAQKQQAPNVVTASTPVDVRTVEPHANSEAQSAPKKKNKKKKKPGVSTSVADAASLVEPNHADNQGVPVELPQGPADEKILLLQQELDVLHTLCADKDAIISRLEKRIKDQEGLVEEIETLRDEVINLGQESVDSKSEVKSLQIERKALGERVTEMEQEIEDLKLKSTTSAKISNAHESLSSDFERLKAKSDTLATDLAAAQKLAATRFRDLSELREALHKAQPELQSLRTEVSDLRRSKDEFLSKAAEARRLEIREKDLKTDLVALKKQLGERDAEVKALTEKQSLALNAKRESDESLRKVQRELKTAQVEQKDAVETSERDAKAFSKSQEELRSARATISKIEAQLTKLDVDATTLREELTLKAAQYASAQSLMTSMQDQTQELSTQMRETRERCDSLEEELADAHRLLGERGREAETMRRLLADVDGRADIRVRGMQERLDAAIEERDRAEEQAGSAGRKRAKELEELRAKVRTAEAALRTAEEQREDVAVQEKQLRLQNEEIEARSAKADAELAEVRDAMARLSNALDETERTARELETDKAELRIALEESTAKLDKLQKSSKNVADELKTLQAQQSSRPGSSSAAPNGNHTASARPSIESSRSGAGGRFASPRPSSTNASNATSISSSAAPAAKVDYVYLKTVLLQFLEQKDKKHQMALVPVLGMLLHFDRQDEKKWMAAIKTT